MRSSASRFVRSTRASASDCSLATAASVSTRTSPTSPSASISSWLIRLWASRNSADSLCASAMARSQFSFARFDACCSFATKAGSAGSGSSRVNVRTDGAA